MVQSISETCTDLDEGAVLGHVGDLAHDLGAGRVALGQAVPRILAQLLQAQGNAAGLAVELQDLGLELLADAQHVAGMLDAPPSDVGDVQQAVDAAQIDEGAVIGDVLDHAVDDGPLVEGLQQSFALLAQRLFQNGAARNNDVVALLVELDDFELDLFALVGGGVLDGAHVDQRPGQEGADAVDHDGHAALDLAGDDAMQNLVLGHRDFQHAPIGGALGFFAGQDGLAVAVLDVLDHDRGHVADLHLKLAFGVEEFLAVDEGFALQAGIDRHALVVDGDDFRGDQLAFLHFLRIFVFGVKARKAF